MVKNRSSDYINEENERAYPLSPKYKNIRLDKTNDKRNAISR